MANSSVTAVREGLKAYTDRGVFRSFNEVKSSSVRYGFEFLWLNDRPMAVKLDISSGTISFRNLLHNIPTKSAMYAELKSFVKARHDPELPEHRRVDPKQAEVTLSNRGGNVTVALKVKKNRYAYGVKKLVNVVHELFLHLHSAYPDYLYENFDVPQE